MNWSMPPRVFVLDDEPVIADTIARILQMSGYDAHARYSSADILDLATEMTPDLLIADVALGPDQITGIEVATYFERFYPGCKAILISGNPTTSDLYREANEQGHHFILLPKPVRPEVLLQQVKTQLTRKAA